MTTPRKPLEPASEGGIEAQIRRAREEGLFDDLPGAGRPLPDLDEVADPLWWAKSWVRREQISLLPPGLEIRARVEKARAALATLDREADVRARLEALDQEIRRCNARATSGPPTRQAPLDVEAEVAAWRRARAAEGEPGADP